MFVQFQIYAQNVERQFVSVSMENYGIKVSVSDGYYMFKPYSNEILETSFVPEGEIFNKDSHAVIMEPQNTQANLDQTETSIKYSTSGIAVEIIKAPFQIKYTYKGKPLVSEKLGYQNIETGKQIQFNLTDSEVIYGAGERVLGMNRRGHKLQLYNRAHYGYETKSELMNFTMPMVLSSKIYAVHFDNAPIGYLDLDSNNNNTLAYETISGRMTYQVIASDSWYNLLDSYTDLTGKQPMLPMWSMGNFSSRFGYHSEAEARATIEKFQKDEIPVDGIILDLQWYGKDVQGHMGNLEVLRDSFPDFEGMVKDFEKLGVHTVPITQPFILTTSKRWDEAVKAKALALDSVGNPYTYDFYFGNTGLVDIFSPEGETWFWEKYKDIMELGIHGIWGDLGEPEVHPSGLLHATGTADEVHNIYGHNWAKLIYEGVRKEYPNKRLFLLMRAGSTGSQRYGMVPWSGDVNRTWGGLYGQTEIALQMGMQGMAYMHSDLGGFAGANLDDELYTRWLQYGVFQPIYRPHAQEDVPSEPVFRSDAAKALAKQSIELRYKLLPYNYNLVFENNQTGVPLMRPLFFDYPDNKYYQTLAGTYFWGKDFLVTPIIHSKEKSVEVHFPIGAVWFDFYTGEKIGGGLTKAIKTHESYIPTYVRGGAFIPMAKPMQSTKEYNPNTIDLHYYHDQSVKSSERSFYSDDGQTAEAFEKGMYQINTYKSMVKGSTLNFEFSQEVGSKYTSKTAEINMVIHNVERMPKYVKVNGEKVNIDFDKQSQTLKIGLTWKPNQELTLKIKN